MKPDNRFFSLKCWRNSETEKEFVHKIYATGLLTPRERQTLAIYHSATYLRFHSFQQHKDNFLKNLANMIALGSKDKETPGTENTLIVLENDLVDAVRTGWHIFDSLGHEINLICWKKAGRKKLFHPYIQEKKISFYMVRERLLVCEKLAQTSITQLLTAETRDPDSRSPHYMMLSNLASRAQHRPLLLGCRWQLGNNSEDDGLGQLLLTESAGMPADNGVDLHDVDIAKQLKLIGEWLADFLDRIYQALGEQI